ncbi:MAG: hypothetical protein KYX69_22630 [Sphingomonas sp.]|uniref:hypothetical protein n=1 Tax=Sphingomonas sp. TaxID=28214 RepID=UPI002601C65A|nr:hypothetical protein [Sphingomonas sp.]MDK2770502.1 hypothetical protein [Sphingomonas sp.]
MIDDQIFDALTSLEHRQQAVEIEATWLASEEQVLAAQAATGELSISRFKTFTMRSERAAMEAEAVLNDLDRLLKELT